MAYRFRDSEASKDWDRDTSPGGNETEEMAPKAQDIVDEVSSGKQKLWTHRERKGFMWGKPNRQAMKKW